MAEDSFKEFVLDQLAALPEVKARAMFGAHGLYQGEQFFAILDEGRLFFKTNETSQADYLARGMKPFTYQARGKRLTMNYHEVPPEILENAPALVTWARQAIGIAAVQPKRRVKPRSAETTRRTHRGK
jgi:DNA transformation protein